VFSILSVCEHQPLPRHRFSVPLRPFRYCRPLASARPRCRPSAFGLGQIRALKTQVSRLESNPNLEVDDAFRAAQQELDKLSQRSLGRDPALREDRTPLGSR